MRYINLGKIDFPIGWNKFPNPQQVIKENRFVYIKQLSSFANSWVLHEASNEISEISKFKPEPDSHLRLVVDTKTGEVLIRNKFKCKHCVLCRKQSGWRE